jgi:erythromycin esterase
MAGKDAKITLTDWCVWSTCPREFEMTESSAAFVAWGREHAVPLNADAELDDFSDLMPLKGIIAGARLVGHGESHHYTREFNRFRFRLLRFLVAEMGFTTFALEVGFVEAKVAHDYVAGRHDDADAAFSSVNQTFGLYAHQQEMLTWMRDYNRDQSDGRKLTFYGMDGSQEWTHAGAAVAAACDYLDDVDAPFAAEVRSEVLPLALEITTSALDQTSTEALRTLTHGLTRLVGRLESEQFPYIDLSSRESFDWALGFAVMAQQIGTVLVEMHSCPDQAWRAWNNIRDFNMARQLCWIAQRQPSGGGVLFGLHNYHLQACTSYEGGAPLSTMGQYLKNSVPDSNLVLIAGQNNVSLKPGDVAVPDSNPGLFSRMDLPSYFLDLRSLGNSPEAYAWASERRPDRLNLNYFPVALAEAFDAIHYTESLTLDELRLPAELMKESIVPDVSILDELVGTYLFHGISNEPEDLFVMREGDRLFTDVGDRNGELFPLYRSELFAVSPTVYRWKEWPAELTFERDKDGVVRKASVHLLTTRYTRYGSKVD